MKCKLNILLFSILLTLIFSLNIVYASDDVVLDPAYTIDPNNIIMLDEDAELWLYRTMRVRDLEGYKGEWETVHYNNYKVNPENEIQGGIPYYGHGVYLDEDPINPPAYSFDNMMKIHKNSHSTLGATDSNIKYYVNRKFSDGFPNFKDRLGIDANYNNIPQPYGSGHFSNPAMDASGKNKGEWRFLGYGIDFKTITNPGFPADYPAVNPDKAFMAKTYNWLREPWKLSSAVTQSEYNKYKTPQAIKGMTRFIEHFGFDKLVSNGALRKDIDKASTMEEKAKIMLDFFAMEALPTDKSAGSMTGVHIKADGSMYYATFFLPALIPAENTNLKIASPYSKIINGQKLYAGSMVDDQGVMRNHVEIYEKNADGSIGKLVSTMPKDGLSEGQYNAELIAGKEYIYRAYVRHYDLAVGGQSTRKTSEVIKLFKHYEYNKRTNPAETAFVFDSEEFDSKPTEQFHGKPMIAGKTKVFEWTEAIPAQINGEKITELKLTANLGGKKTLPDGSIISYPTDNIYTTADDSSTIRIKIKDALPNLTVANPANPITADDGTTKTNLELYEISSTGALTKVAISDTKDSKGFNGYIEKHKRYAVRVYINNNTVIPAYTTKGNVTANIELNYNQRNSGNYKEGNTALDSKSYRTGDTGIYTATPIPPEKTEAIEYQFEVKDKIDNSTTTTLKIMASIANGLNCDTTDNSNLNDDKTEIFLGIGLPSLPNLKVMSANYPDKDNTGVTRNRIEVYDKKTNKLLNPATDRLVRGETYIFKTYMKYYPNPNVPTQAGSTIATEIRLDRWLSYKKGTGEITNLSAMGGQALPYLKFGRLTAPNQATATFVEEIKIPMDADLSPFKYRVKVDPIHMNGDNQQTMMDDEAEAVFELDAVAPNLIIDKIEARLVGSSAVIPPGERLQPGKTYNFKVYMRYANPNPMATTQSFNILCDYGISTDYLSYLPKGSIYEAGTPKLVSTNFANKSLKSGDVSVFSYNQLISLNMGNTFTFEARVPSNYSADNAITADDKMSVSYNLGAEDLMAYDMAFYYNGSKITDGKMKAIPSTAVYQAKFKVKKVAGTTKSSPIQTYVQVQDMSGNVLVGQTLTGRALNGLNDEIEFVINNIRPDNSTNLTAVAQIADFHTTKGENSNTGNDITMATISADTLDLGIINFKVNPMKVTVGEGEAPKPMNLGFSALIACANSLNTVVGNGTNSVEFVIKDSTGAVIFSKFLVVPANKQVSINYTIPNYQLRNGNNTFTAEINPYRNPVEISSSHADPYWNNRATASTLVTQNNEPIPCEKGVTTKTSNSWSETFYITKRSGTKRSYDCSYTNSQGRTVKRTCYYCDPDNWDYSEKTVRFTETISIPYVYFRSQATIDLYGGDGWINIADGNKDAVVKAGGGFELRIYTLFQTNRDRLRLKSSYRDMCNYTTVNPGVYEQSNVQRISVTIPQFKDKNGVPITYLMTPLETSGTWDNSTKLFSFPLRNAFGKEMNRKVYVGENVKDMDIAVKIVTEKFQPYDTSQGQRMLQECKTVYIRVQGNNRIRSQILN